MEYHQTFISTLGVKSSRLLLYPTRSHPHTSPSPYYRPPFCFRSYFSSLLSVPSVSIESTHEPSKLSDLNPPSLHLSPSSHFVSSRRVEPTHSIVYSVSTVQLGKLLLKLIMSKIYFPCKMHISCTEEVTYGNACTIDLQCYRKPSWSVRYILQSSHTMRVISVSLSSFVMRTLYKSCTNGRIAFQVITKTVCVCVCVCVCVVCITQCSNYFIPVLIMHCYPIMFFKVLY